MCCYQNNETCGRYSDGFFSDQHFSPRWWLHEVLFIAFIYMGSILYASTMTITFISLFHFHGMLFTLLQWITGYTFLIYYYSVLLYGCLSEPGLPFFYWCQSEVPFYQVWTIPIKLSFLAWLTFYIHFITHTVGVWVHR